MVNKDASIVKGIWILHVLYQDSEKVLREGYFRYISPPSWKPSQCSHSIRKVTHATVNRNQITRRSRTLTPINLNLTLRAHLQWRRLKETEKIFLWLLPLILERRYGTTFSQHMQFSCFCMCHCIFGKRATGFNRSMKSIFSSRERERA